MATYYYYYNGTGKLTDYNWYNDLNHTSFYNGLPTSSDDVYILSNISDNINSPLYNSLSATCSVFDDGGGTNFVSANTFIFLSACNNSFNLSGINITFNKNSTNTGSLTSDTLTFNDFSYNGSGGTYFTRLTFYNSVNKKGGINSPVLST